MTKIEIDEEERFQVHYKANKAHYVYLKRLARATPRGSLQRVIDQRLFPRGWRKEDESLRDAQRKLGMKDSEFLPPALQKRMGLKVKQGRERLPYRRRKRGAA